MSLVHWDLHLLSITYGFQSEVKIYCDLLIRTCLKLVTPAEIKAFNFLPRPWNFCYTGVLLYNLLIPKLQGIKPAFACRFIFDKNETVISI